MDRRRQPAMRAGGGGTRDDRYRDEHDGYDQGYEPGYDQGYDYGSELDPRDSGFGAWFRRASALTRWIILIVFVGLGTAALVAIGVAALVTLLESSV